MPVQHWTLETFDEFISKNDIDPNEGLRALEGIGIRKDQLSELATLGLTVRLLDGADPVDAMVATSVGMFLFGFEVGRREGRTDGEPTE